METYALISSPKLVLLGSSSNVKGLRRGHQHQQRSGFLVAALNNNTNHPATIRQQIYSFKGNGNAFASISSSTSSSVGVRPDIYVPPPSSNTGSPLFWIGVGVGLSALFSWVATNSKKYFMQQAFKTMMGQMSSQNTTPFPFPPPTITNTPSPSKPFLTVDVPAAKLEAPPANQLNSNKPLIKQEPNKYAFVDVSPEEMLPFNTSQHIEDTTSNTDQVSENGAATKQDTTAYNEHSNSSRKAGSVLSVEALEKMMEDPTVQKMVFPYLPEEMRNPTTFKWMLQNPQYRQQLEDMLNNMGGSGEWDNKMMDSLKSFDLSSPEVKQQFDQIGLTPEEVISKIMANPEIAVAFQNPRVQAAIMDCSQNPLSIAKYQNDKEVMDVFNKISELFPGVTGSP